jgi:hypothetical protein
MTRKATLEAWEWARAGCKVTRKQYPYTVCQISIGGLDEDKLNARGNLIAAAPDMLAALKDFVGYYPAGINPYLDSAASAARAAIAKATGP